MKRTVALTSGLAVALVGLVAVPASAVSIETWKPGDCYVGDKYCGGGVWVKLSAEQTSRIKHNAGAVASSGYLTKRGKRIKLQRYDSNIDDMGGSGKHFGEATEFYRNKKTQGPLWWFPTGLKKGTYTLTWSVKQEGKWNCSLNHYDVCEWGGPVKWSGTTKVKVKGGKPEWFTHENYGDYPYE